MYNFNNRILKLTVILLFCFSSYAVNAQTAFLSATASKPVVSLNEQFQLTYSISGSASNFRGPDLSEFHILSGPNQSTSIQYSNGNYSQTLSLSYILQAKREGQFKIGPASVDSEGKRIASNVVNLSVVKGSAPAAGNQRQQQDRTQEEATGLSDKNIFIRAFVSRNNAVQGESVTVTFKLYTNVNIVNYTVNKMPAFNGFWNQDIDLPRQLDLVTEVVDGVSYKAGVIKKVILFPQQSGTLTIEPMELECIARIKVKSRMNDPFGVFNDPFLNDPFFGMGGVRDVKYNFKSNTVKVNVSPLPAPSPDGFSGTVGQVNFSATLDRENVKENDPVTLKIKISGSGNLKLTEPPSLQLPDNIEIYDPKISENLKAHDNGLSGTKTFEYLLVPRHEGSYTLEPLVFSWYDPQKKQYQTKKAGPFVINVERGSGSDASVATALPGKTDFQVIGKDIRYIKVKQPDFKKGNDSFFGTPSFYALSFAPVILFCGLLVVRRQKEKLESNVHALKSRNANAMAKKRLATAKGLLTEGTAQQSRVYEEVLRAMWGYISDRLSIPLSGLTKENVSAELKIKKVSDKTIADLLDIIQECEMARYAGVTATGAGEVYNKGLELISRIENETA